MAHYAVKNWETFQHYKDRSPPWIKLHRDLLRDYDFSCLQDASKLHLMLLWLLASQLDNKIPTDEAWITRQLGLAEPVNLNPLLNKGFLYLVQDASEPLADCKQSAIGETEAEAYKPVETEAEAAPKKPARKTQLKIETLPDEWLDYCKNRRPELTPEIVFENFRDFYLSHGRAMQDWTRTWQRWVRNEAAYGNSQHRTRETTVQARDRRNAEALAAAGG